MNELELLALISCMILSVCGSMLTSIVLSNSMDVFIKAGLYGVDMCKKKVSEIKKVPEATGVVVGAVYIVITFLFMPVVFYVELNNTNDARHDLIQYLSALLSISCMVLLGFADDVFNLRWRIKLFLPAIASLPLLIVYFLNCNSTTVILPSVFRLYGWTNLNLGVFYYFYMGMLAVFCTHAINILAGINGVEIGQSLVIACSIIIFNILEMNGCNRKVHFFSLCLTLPYVFLCVPLFRCNWYPASLFVGDTFCYFSGMLFAVDGILGHFGKTIILFFIPQIFNFCLSVPQLFGIMPCPRHRLPRFEEKTNLLHCSEFEIRYENLNVLSQSILSAFEVFGLVRSRKDEKTLYVSNFTILNTVLIWSGPVTERKLCILIIAIQVLCSCLAFFIRYKVALLLY